MRPAPERTRRSALAAREGPGAVRERPCSAVLPRPAEHVGRERAVDLVRGDEHRQVDGAAAPELRRLRVDRVPVVHAPGDLGDVGRQPEAVPLVLERVDAQRQEQVVPPQRRDARPGHADGPRALHQALERRRVGEADRHEVRVHVDRRPGGARRALERRLPVDPQVAGLLAVAPLGRGKAEVREGARDAPKVLPPDEEGRCPRTAAWRRPRTPGPATAL